jgi:hypothetical protein
MKFARLFLIGTATAISSARAIYAPVPDTGIQKDLQVSLRLGVLYDNNIFGAQSNPISSAVYQASPRIAYSASLSDQTFASVGYTLTLDHFDRRPGTKTLDSHDLTARLAHAFSPTSSADVSDQYQIAKNPESLLAGLPVNSNQSFKRNELNARYVASPLPKFEGTIKFRSVNYRYDNPVLAGSLDRTENLFGLSASEAVAPKMKAVAEYRHEDIAYRTDGSMKDKQSDFLIGGVDYAVAKKFSLTSRFGNQWRKRSSERSTSGLYTEISAKYDYAERSFVTAGYVYTLEETSNVALYNDTRVNRMFVNVQHSLSALLVASGSVTYEPSQLQGRRGIPNADETTTRVGVALTWLATPQWSFTGSFDHDRIVSDIRSRGQERDREGVSATYAF